METEIKTTAAGSDVYVKYTDKGNLITTQNDKVVWYSPSEIKELLNFLNQLNLGDK